MLKRCTGCRKTCYFSQECQEEHLNKVHNWHLRLFRGRVWTSLLSTKRRLFATAQEGGCNQEGLELKDLLDCSLFKVKGKWKESKLCIDKLLFLYDICCNNPESLKGLIYLDLASSFLLLRQNLCNPKGSRPKIMFYGQADLRGEVSPVGPDRKQM